MSASIISLYTSFHCTTTLISIGTNLCIVALRSSTIAIVRIVDASRGISASLINHFVVLKLVGVLVGAISRVGCVVCIVMEIGGVIRVVVVIVMLIYIGVGIVVVLVVPVLMICPVLSLLTIAILRVIVVVIDVT